VRAIITIWLIIYVLLLSYENNLQTELIKKLDVEVTLLREVQKLKEERAPATAQTWRGIASYYSQAGCLGCREDFITASGEVFDENKPTLAFNWLPMGTQVSVTNTANGKTITAKVNDTGGFNELGRIADLSKGLKEAIGCDDLCNVEISVFQDADVG